MRILPGFLGSVLRDGDTFLDHSIIFKKTFQGQVLRDHVSVSPEGFAVPWAA